VGEEFEGWLDPYVRRPPRRLLPDRKRRYRGGLGHVMAAVPEPVEAALDLAVDVAFRGVGRLVHGRAWRGGWDSDAGRFVVAVVHPHWLRLGERRYTALRLAPAPGGVVLLSPAGRADPVPCALRPVLPPARQRHRLDLVFPDGSWVALRLRTSAGAARLRAVMAGER
jgi:hypothetical protein